MGASRSMMAVAGGVVPVEGIRKVAGPIYFYFDFSSPYGYLASRRIEAMAARHGRGVAWRPFLLGVAFQKTGQSPLVEQPLRGAYHERDFARSARLHGIPFRLPEPEMGKFYRAIAAFDRLANDPALQWRRGLRRGDLLIFDNWRVLHGRTAFVGSRRMAGCYLNREDFESRLRLARGEI